VGGVWSPDRGADDRGADGAPPGIEPAGELGVSVADEMANGVPGLRQLRA